MNIVASSVLWVQVCHHYPMRSFYDPAINKTFFSPNTPGLRNLQAKAELKSLLAALAAVRNNSSPPLFLKLSPDLSRQEKEDIADVLRDPKYRVDGLIISNTTLQRPTLRDGNKQESGGLSGAPLKDLATETVRDMYQLTNGMPIIGKVLDLPLIMCDHRRITYSQVVWRVFTIVHNQMCVKLVLICMYV